jgi:ParB family chromosome partitioning protein
VSQVVYRNAEELTIVTDKLHPLYDERVELPIDQRLVESIGTTGILHPVTIARDGLFLVVVDGRQRVRAAIEASKITHREIKIPTILQHGSDADLFEITVASNELRTADNEIVRAQKIKRLMSLTGADAKRVAIAFGLSLSHVRNLVAILDAAPEVQEKVIQKAISLSSAVNISKNTERREQKNKVLQHLQNAAFEVDEEKKKVARAYLRMCKSAKQMRAELDSKLLKKEKNGELSEFDHGWVECLKWCLGVFE